MKRFKKWNNWIKARGFTNGLLYYGVFLKGTVLNPYASRFYTVQLVNSPIKKAILFHSQRKPMLPFWAWTIIGAIMLGVQWLAYLVWGCLATIFCLLFGFIGQCLFRESFITGWFERVSGYLWLIFGLIGMISVIKLIW